MPRRPQHAHLFELATCGAEVRLREWAQETRNLIKLFPHLRDSFDKDELPLPFIIAKGAGRVTRTSAEHSQMPAAARQAVSERMKKYWAARRKAAKP